MIVVHMSVVCMRLECILIIACQCHSHMASEGSAMEVSYNASLNPLGTFPFETPDVCQSGARNIERHWDC